MNNRNLCQAQQFVIHAGALHGMTNKNDIDNLNHVKAVATQFTDSIGAKTPELKRLSFLNPGEKDPHKVAIIFDDGSLVKIGQGIPNELDRLFGVVESIDLFWLSSELAIPASLGWDYEEVI
ncbi:hypothetical protein [Vibrio fluvialis]|uniref:hypothetical protein n=1 Tax=Vibrio fluvialis TaxID=676 RepID=UPI0028F7022C|nr:hypothetical protein [Vibrio fluvialis]